MFDAHASTRTAHMSRTHLYMTPIVRVSGILGSGSHGARASVYPLLTESRGELNPDGTCRMIFLLYDVPLGGCPLWRESHDVKTELGVFSIDLGLQVSLPPGICGPYWVSIHIDGEPEPPERQPFDIASDHVVGEIPS